MTGDLQHSSRSLLHICRCMATSNSVVGSLPIRVSNKKCKFAVYIPQSSFPKQHISLLLSCCSHSHLHMLAGVPYTTKWQTVQQYEWWMDGPYMFVLHAFDGAACSSTWLKICSQWALTDVILRTCCSVHMTQGLLSIGDHRCGSYDLAPECNPNTNTQKAKLSQQ